MRDKIGELMNVYWEVTGLKVGLSRSRARALSQLVERGITSEDMRDVLKGIMAHIRRGTDGYVEASILPHNTFERVDIFEGRALLCRQHRIRMAARKPKPQVARADAAGVTRLDEAPTVEPKLASAAAALFAMAEDITAKEAAAQKGEPSC